MRKVFSIIFDFIAGFFFYGVILMGFINVSSSVAKWILVIIFLVFAVTPLYVSLALKHFQNWKSGIGIVLLSASGFTAFGIFTFACMLMTEDFQKMFKPDTREIFSDYIAGSVMLLSCAGLGLWLYKSDKGIAKQSDKPDELSRIADVES